MGSISSGVDSLYGKWFLAYASYVILERAIPLLDDGLKPVQRRLLHAMKGLEDGRYNKVANIIGQTMQYHPHGDASISEALVHLGQKGYLIDTQGNWGNTHTGDEAAAARYIEARLSRFALSILFNEKTTQWRPAYDGRRQEPTALPVKFPLLLLQGAEGIAVGLSTRIMPHNLQELIQAAIQYLKEEPYTLYPDFPGSGYMDVSQYQDGQKGGKIRTRAAIDIVDKSTLVIQSLPYGTTTHSLIDSIVKAIEKNTIKVKNITDNTSSEVNIALKLPSGSVASQTKEALYAFTQCEVSIGVNACVIDKEAPVFVSTRDILERSVARTRALLGQELAIRQKELLEKQLSTTMERIFIETRMYRSIEGCASFAEVLSVLKKGFMPYEKDLYRPIKEEDLASLTELRIRRISRYQAEETDQRLQQLAKDLATTVRHLKNLTQYTIAYYEDLMRTYGIQAVRQTKISTFGAVQAQKVALTNEKLYVAYKEGFVGYEMKKETYVCNCSTIDKIIVFTADGHGVVKRVEPKAFVGKPIQYAHVYKEEEVQKTYHMIYYHGEKKRFYAKRFVFQSIILDKRYNLCQSEGSRIMYLSVHSVPCAEVVEIRLSSRCRARKKVFEFDFGSLDIKGRMARGNLLTPYPIQRVKALKQVSKTPTKDLTSKKSKSNLWD